LLVLVSDVNGEYYYLTKESNNYNSGTLIKEIKYVTGSLVELLGIDCNEKNLFDVSEIDSEGKWGGRIWCNETIVIALNYQDKLQLTFYPTAYVDKNLCDEF
jgi:hypothetical protein